MEIRDLRDKKIALLGLGVENQALLEWLEKHDLGKEIIVGDRNKNLKSQISKLKITTKNLKLKWRLGEDYLKNLTDFDIVFRTPGIHYLTPQIQEAKKKNVIISSAVKLFFDLCPAKIIGVTGTKGKGTTATLIAEILKCNVKCQMSNVKVWLGGNVGISPFEFLDRIKKDDFVVLELSSFQLQDLEKSPQIAVVLNISSDHLDIHQSCREYIEAKYNIVSHQSKNDFAVINADYLTSVEFGAGTMARVSWFSTRKSVDEGVYVQNFPNKIILRKNDQDVLICRADELKLVGPHNWENVCAAAAVAGILKVPIKIIREAVISFRGLPNRLELIAEIKAVKYYNDSFSTNPAATIAALHSFNAPIHLILGGSSKQADFRELIDEITKSTVKSIIFLGRDEAIKIKKIVKEKMEGKSINLVDTDSMQEAVKKAKELAGEGEIVLLSPACASFDLFRDYKERGEKFRNALSRLS